MRLAGKVALITGGGTGIGRATAELFANEGAKVAISGLHIEDLENVVQSITKHGGEAIAIPGDVTNEDSAKKMVITPIDRWKRLDILVNNAGVIKRVELHETASDDWDHMMNTNVKGIYLLSKFTIPVMINHGGGAEKVRSRIS